METAAETTAKNILEILRTQPIIIMSWGLEPESVRIAESEGNYGLQFKVNGFLHKGKTQILYNEGSDTFTIRLLNPNDTVKETRENVYCNELVSTVDRMVELCDNYVDAVLMNYGLSQE